LGQLTPLQGEPSSISANPLSALLAVCSSALSIR
jgi:hypothetical protein